MHFNSIESPITLTWICVAGSGGLDEEEVAELVKELTGGKLTKRLMKKAMKIMDTDGSGVVEFDEFHVWWQVRHCATVVAAAAANLLRWTQEHYDLSKQDGFFSLLTQYDIKKGGKKYQLSVSGMGLQLFDSKGKPTENYLYKSMEGWRENNGDLEIKFLDGNKTVRIKSNDSEEIAAAMTAEASKLAVAQHNAVSELATNAPSPELSPAEESTAVRQPALDQPSLAAEDESKTPGPTPAKAPATPITATPSVRQLGGPIELAEPAATMLQPSPPLLRAATVETAEQAAQTIMVALQTRPWHPECDWDLEADEWQLAFADAEIEQEQKLREKVERDAVDLEHMLEKRVERLTDEVAAERREKAVLSVALDEEKAALAAEEEESAKTAAASSKTIASLHANVAELEAKAAATSQAAIDRAVRDAVRAAVAETTRQCAEEMSMAVGHLEAASADNLATAGAKAESRVLRTKTAASEAAAALKEQLGGLELRVEHAELRALVAEQKMATMRSVVLGAEEAAQLARRTAAEAVKAAADARETEQAAVEAATEGRIRYPVLTLSELGKAGLTATVYEDLGDGRDAFICSVPAAVGVDGVHRFEWQSAKRSDLTVVLTLSSEVTDDIDLATVAIAPEPMVGRLREALTSTREHLARAERALLQTGVRPGTSTDESNRSTVGDKGGDDNEDDMMLAALAWLETSVEPAQQNLAVAPREQQSDAPSTWQPRQLHNSSEIEQETDVPPPAEETGPVLTMAAEHMVAKLGWALAAELLCQGCGMLVYKPVMLNCCGHAVAICSDCLGPDATRQSAAQLARSRLAPAGPAWGQLSRDLRRELVKAEATSSCKSTDCPNCGCRPTERPEPDHIRALVISAAAAAAVRHLSSGHGHASTSSACTCEKHVLPVDAYCHTCRTPICTECATASCAGHQRFSLHYAAEEAARRLKGAANKLQPAGIARVVAQAKEAVAQAAVAGQKQAVAVEAEFGRLATLLAQKKADILGQLVEAAAATGGRLRRVELWACGWYAEMGRLAALVEAVDQAMASGGAEAASAVLAGGDRLLQRLERAAAVAWSLGSKEAALARLASAVDGRLAAAPEALAAIGRLDLRCNTELRLPLIGEPSSDGLAHKQRQPWLWEPAAVPAGAGVASLGLGLGDLAVGGDWVSEGCGKLAEAAVRGSVDGQYALALVVLTVDEVELSREAWPLPPLLQICAATVVSALAGPAPVPTPALPTKQAAARMLRHGAAAGHLPSLHCLAALLFQEPATGSPMPLLPSAGEPETTSSAVALAERAALLGFRPARLLAGRLLAAPLPGRLWVPGELAGRRRGLAHLGRGAAAGDAAAAAVGAEVLLAGLRQSAGAAAGAAETPVLVGDERSRVGWLGGGPAASAVECARLADQAAEAGLVEGAAARAEVAVICRATALGDRSAGELPAAARAVLERAAGLDSAAAFALGLWLLQDSGSRAAELLKSSAAAHHPPALYALGRLELATEELKGGGGGGGSVGWSHIGRAAQLGHAPAARVFGFRCLDTSIAPTAGRAREGFSWLERAAEAGDLPAGRWLAAHADHNGQHASAARWLSICVAGGDGEAAARLLELSDGNGGGMSDDDAANAAELLELDAAEAISVPRRLLESELEDGSSVSSVHSVESAVM